MVSAVSSPLFRPEWDSGRSLRRTVDARLAPALALSWGLCAYIVVTRRELAAAGVLWAVVAVVVAVALAMVALWSRPVAGMLAPYCGVALACGAVAAVRAGLAIERARGFVLGGRVVSGADAPVLRVSGFPKVMQGSPPRLGVEVEFTGVSGGGVQGDVLLVGSQQQLAGVGPGDQLVGVVQVSPSSRPGIAPIMCTIVQGKTTQGGPGQSGPGPAWQVIFDQGLWARLVRGIRQGVGEMVSQHLPQDLAGLARGMVMGDTSGQSAADRLAFVQSGLSHLSAVSGANVVIVMGAAVAVVSTERPVVRWAAAVGAVGVFVCVVGADPSVLRAAVTALIGVAAVIQGRSKQSFAVLMAAGCGLLWWDPGLSVDVGFMLSMAATAGLILWASRLAGILMRCVGNPDAGTLGRLGRAVCEAVAVCVAADVATTPLVVLMTGRVNVLSMVANLAVAGVVAPVTIVGTLLIGVRMVAMLMWALPGVGFVGQGLMVAGGWLASLLYPLLWWIMGVARWIGGAGVSSWQVQGAQGVWWVVAWVGVVMLIVSVGRLLVFWWARMGPPGDDEGRRLNGTGAHHYREE